MESHFKTCTKCKETKPWTEFNKDRRAKEGLRSKCRACQKQYYQENREYYKQYCKQWHQENREQRLEYAKQYYQENREQILEYDKQYRQENREYYKQYCKQWHQENREKVAAKSAKRRALKRESVPEALADCPEEKDRVNKIYKLRDLLTRATGVEYHVDHIWPLSKGGPHWSGNLQIITAEENLSKHASFCEDTVRVIEESLHEYLSARQ